MKHSTSGRSLVSDEPDNLRVNTCGCNIEGAKEKVKPSKVRGTEHSRDPRTKRPSRGALSRFSAMIGLQLLPEVMRHLARCAARVGAVLLAMAGAKSSMPVSRAAGSNASGERKGGRAAPRGRERRVARPSAAHDDSQPLAAGAGHSDSRGSHARQDAGRGGVMVGVTVGPAQCDLHCATPSLRERVSHT